MFSYIISVLAFVCTPIFKMSFVIGSRAACFSPLLAIPVACAGHSGIRVILYAILTKLSFAFLTGSALFSASSTYLPTLCAAWYWQSHNIRLKQTITALCMILFLLHPVGHAAWFYSLYWIIPLWAARHKSLFVKALGATFLAHAVGSVIWIWLVPMNPYQFWLLMPVVFFERIILALSIVISHYMLEYIRNISSYYFSQHWYVPRNFFKNVNNF